MPELPEVETVRRGVADWVTDRVIDAVEVLHPRAIRRHLPGPDHFAAALSGVTVTGASRRGKYLWLPLDSEDALICHLGMSGQLLVQPADAPDEKHLRIRLRLRGQGHELRFVDQRTFGEMLISPKGAELPAEIAHIGLDPYDAKFDATTAAKAMRARDTEVKRALLDQTLISGVGNIYADEALWRSRLHWSRPTRRLTMKRALELIGHVRDVFDDALRAGGTSFDALYVNVNGESGYFDRSLAAYGREGQACSRCGTAIVREQFMNRSSFGCPRCQRKRSL
ncbi:bifunctional DNA-formamidopyrimidine glycosylase/DNA-(apurinic or apyrimidinic site) lyase [Stackebrandtia soli]|uniref:bifunctional DNA-formamidopyrimidine glycosylase/DNA-(apurinic or apyrimidinic site) lyase n=1 Tax=Stackebrandtia soli TaxID=1892856 RepID=UPI0039E9DB55